MTRKKLLCMLLSAAVAFTTMNVPASASEVYTADETNEAAASQEGTSDENSVSQEGIPAQTETKEKDTPDAAESEDPVSSESSSEPAQEGTASGSDDADQTPPESETILFEDVKSAETKEITDSELPAETDTGLQAVYHTADEILEFISQEKASRADKTTYETDPVPKAPYSAGVLSGAALDSAAAMVRQIRFIAGLEYDVSVNDEYNHFSQSAALLNYVNHTVSHNPSRPEDMPEELYEQGCKGAAYSSAACTDEQTQTLNAVILDTWMAETGSESLCALENRRRILNPFMEQIGFGMVKGENGIYSAMYTSESAGNGESRLRIAWPAQNMPVEYFDIESPWSVSTGEITDASDICVALTRKSDKKEWTFSADASDGAFYIENDRSAQESYIIFRPETAEIPEYADGDSFQVEITKNGKPYISYSVDFFSISNKEEKLTAPRASIASGEVIAKGSGLVLTSEENASVYYTLDETIPTTESTLYTEPIVIQSDITVNAVAIKEGCTDSDTATFTYTVGDDVPLHCTVTFSLDDDTILPAQSVLKNETIEPPESPMKEGYVFDSWYKETSCENKWDFENDTVTEDITLYAKWIQPENADLSTADPRGAEDTTEPVDLSLAQTNTEIKDIKPRVYNGKAYEPNVTVTISSGSKKITLKKGRDYTAKYYNNINAGENKAYVTVTGTGRYKGSVSKYFSITPKSMSKLKIITESKSVSDSSVNIYVFDGTAFVNRNQYTVQYHIDSQNPKNATAEITAKENTNYTGTVTVKLTVYDVPPENLINKGSVALAGDAPVYTGKAVTRNITLKAKDGSVLKQNTDFSVKYQNNTNAGTATVIITGKGKYKGRIVRTFSIAKADIGMKAPTDTQDAHVTIADISPRTYNGKAQKPAVSIKTIRSKKLALNKDYTVKYSNNLHQGTAVIQITGAGNNCKGTANITFEIRPQEIKKASVSVTKAEENVPGRIVLKYNKKELQEYADYRILKYEEVPNKKGRFKVTIEGLADFKGETVKTLKTELPSPEPDDAPAVSNNLNKHNYLNFKDYGLEAASNLFQNDDGTLTRVEHVRGKGVYVERYTADYKFISQEKFIKTELPIFGGFYASKDNYFLVFGQKNPAHDDNTEVIRFVKYDKDWNRQGDARLYGINTAEPFIFSSVRMADHEGVLYIRTGHNMYNGHQANMAFSIHIEDMKFINQFYTLGGPAIASHSLNQFITMDEPYLITADHGDAYPRGMILSRHKKAGAQNTYFTSQKSAESITALKVGGSAPSNVTGASLGGLEASDTHYLVAGNSVDQTPETYNPRGPLNIYVSSTPKDNFKNDAVNVHWITNYNKYIEYTDSNGNPQKVPETVVNTPQLVKLNGSEMMLLWTEGTRILKNNAPVLDTATVQIKSVLLNGAGEPVSGIYSFKGGISDCKPILVNGNLVWYYTNNSAPKFCTLNPEDVRKQPR